MNATTINSKKVNSINTITVEIEEAFNNNFSIVVFDEQGGLFVEKFAATYEKAVEVANKMFAKACAQY